jgi:hypothetical protein
VELDCFGGNYLMINCIDASYYSAIPVGYFQVIYETGKQPEK